MNETRTINIANSEVKTKTREDIHEERITKLEEAVFKEPTEANGPADEEAMIIINGDVDRKLYAKVCTLCLSEDGVNVIYKEGDKEKARACFENEMKPVIVINYLMETYELSVRTANCLRRAYGSINAPKAKLVRWLRTLLENNGEKLAKVRNLGMRSFKEVMEKVGNK